MAPPSQSQGREPERWLSDLETAHSETRRDIHELRNAVQRIVAELAELRKEVAVFTRGAEKDSSAADRRFDSVERKITDLGKKVEDEYVSKTSIARMQQLQLWVERALFSLALFAFGYMLKITFMPH